MVNGAALGRIEAGELVEARTLLLVAERQMHAIGKQFYDCLKKSPVIPRSGATTPTSSSGGGRRRTLRQGYALFASLTLNNLASLERKIRSEEVLHRDQDKDETDAQVDQDNHQEQQDHTDHQGAAPSSSSPSFPSSSSNKAKQDTKHLHRALQYLTASRMWVPELPPADAAATFLNLSAVLSELNRHDEAEEAAMNAVRRSEQDIMRLSSITPEEYASKVASLAVAYNNWAVQKELLGGTSAQCPNDALELYRKALMLATEHLHPRHPLRQKFEASVTAVVERNRRLQDQNYDDAVQSGGRAGGGSRVAEEWCAWIARNRSADGTSNAVLPHASTSTDQARREMREITPPAHQQIVHKAKPDGIEDEQEQEQESAYSPPDISRTPVVTSGAAEALRLRNSTPENSSPKEKLLARLIDCSPPSAARTNATEDCDAARSDQKEHVTTSSWLSRVRESLEKDLKQASLLEEREQDAVDDETRKDEDHNIPSAPTAAPPLLSSPNKRRRERESQQLPALPLAAPSFEPREMTQLTTPVATPIPMDRGDTPHMMAISSIMALSSKLTSGRRSGTVETPTCEKVTGGGGATASAATSKMSAAAASTFVNSNARKPIVVPRLAFLSGGPASVSTTDHGEASSSSSSAVEQAGDASSSCYPPVGVEQDDSPTSEQEPRTSLADGRAYSFAALQPSDSHKSVGIGDHRRAFNASSSLRIPPIVKNSANNSTAALHHKAFGLGSPLLASSSGAPSCRTECSTTTHASTRPALLPSLKVPSLARVNSGAGGTQPAHLQGPSQAQPGPGANSFIINSARSTNSRRRVPGSPLTLSQAGSPRRQLQKLPTQEQDSRTSFHLTSPGMVSAAVSSKLLGAPHDSTPQLQLDSSSSSGLMTKSLSGRSVAPAVEKPMIKTVLGMPNFQMGGSSSSDSRQQSSTTSGASSSRRARRTVDQSRAAGKIQRWFRKRLDRDAARISEQDEGQEESQEADINMAAEDQCVQQAAADAIAAVEQERLAELAQQILRSSSARPIQRVWRQHRSRRKQKRTAAAQKIQASVRAHNQHRRHHVYLRRRRKIEAELTFERFADWKFWSTRTRTREKSEAAAAIQAKMKNYVDTDLLGILRKHQKERDEAERQLRREAAIAALCECARKRQNTEAMRTAVGQLALHAKHTKHCQSFLVVFFAHRFRHVWPRRARGRRAAVIQAFARGYQLRKRLLSDDAFVHVFSVVKDVSEGAGRRVVLVASRKFANISKRTPRGEVEQEMEQDLSSSTWRIEIADYSRVLDQPSKTPSRRSRRASAGGDFNPGLAEKRAIATQAVFTSALLRGAAPDAVLFLSDSEMAGEKRAKKSESTQPALLAKDFLSTLPVDKVLAASLFSRDEDTESGAKLLFGLQSLNRNLVERQDRWTSAILPKRDTTTAVSEAPTPTAPALASTRVLTRTEPSSDGVASVAATRALTTEPSSVVEAEDEAIEETKKAPEEVDGVCASRRLMHEDEICSPSSRPRASTAVVEEVPLAASTEVEVHHSCVSKNTSTSTETESTQDVKPAEQEQQRANPEARSSPTSSSQPSSHQADPPSARASPSDGATPFTSTQDVSAMLLAREEVEDPHHETSTLNLTCKPPEVRAATCTSKTTAVGESSTSTPPIIQEDEDDEETTCCQENLDPGENDTSRSSPRPPQHRRGVNEDQQPTLSQRYSGFDTKDLAKKVDERMRSSMASSAANDTARAEKDVALMGTSQKSTKEELQHVETPPLEPAQPPLVDIHDEHDQVSPPLLRRSGAEQRGAAIAIEDEFSAEKVENAVKVEEASEAMATTTTREGGKSTGDHNEHQQDKPLTITTKSEENYPTQHQVQLVEAEEASSKMPPAAPRPAMKAEPVLVDAPLAPAPQPKSSGAWEDLMDELELYENETGGPKILGRTTTTVLDQDAEDDLQLDTKRTLILPSPHIETIAGVVSPARGRSSGILGKDVDVLGVVEGPRSRSGTATGSCDRGGAQQVVQHDYNPNDPAAAQERFPFAAPSATSATAEIMLGTSNAPADGGQANGGGELRMPWRCSDCNFLNEVSPDMCVMCDHMRVAAPQRPRSSKSRSAGASAGPPTAASADSIAKRKRAATKGEVASFSRVQQMKASYQGGDDKLYTQMFRTSADFYNKATGAALSSASSGGTSNTTKTRPRSAHPATNKRPMSATSTRSSQAARPSSATRAKDSYRDPQPFWNTLR
ncbi:unnamed protein product [Amoebophrya sp. A25]|nr:unnamed protein product [Amoebophrya sp. A25]|eukprot:GSA25T00010059001.1